MVTTDLEASQENSDAVAEHQEVPKEEAAMETIEALEDRYGECYLAASRRRQPTKRTQGDGGSRQKLVATAVPFRQSARARSSGARQGQCCTRTFEKRRRGRPKRKNGIRGRCLRRQLRLGSKKAFNKTVSRLSGWRS
jgi:hypothetical protein